MIRNNLHPNIPGRATVDLIGPVPRHSKETRLQIGVMSFGRHLSKLRCQTQAFKLALEVVFGIGHAHLLEEVKDRTPSLILSVVHTTEEPPRVREGKAGLLARQKRLGELFCSDARRLSSDNPLKALAEI
jgi:hypothetical protein